MALPTANRDPAMDNKELIEKVRSALAEAIGNVINETIAGIVKEVCDQVSSPRPRVISKMAKNLQTGDRVELTSGMVISMSCWSMTGDVVCFGDVGGTVYSAAADDRFRVHPPLQG